MCEETADAVFYVFFFVVSGDHGAYHALYCNVWVEMPTIETPHAIRRAVLSTLTPAFGGARQCALLDIASLANTGDAMLYLGARALFDECGIEVTYVADARTLNERELRRCLPAGGLIALSGGGHFVDVWESLLRFRIDVIRNFPDYTVVQLPNSFALKDPFLRAELKAAADAHSSFRLFLRDEKSMERAKEAGLVPELCPDLAFMLHPAEGVHSARRGPVCVLRSDLEAVERTAVTMEGARTVPWNRNRRPRFIFLLSLKAVVVGFRALRLERFETFASRVFARYADAFSRRQWDDARRALAGSNVVVSDRLHVALTALLLGIPHIVIDNSYGKISSLFATWLSHSSLTHFVDSRAKAAEMLKDYTV